MLLVIDYISVVNIGQAPRFSVYKISSDTTIYYDKNLNIWFIKDGYKDEESSTGSWIFSTNPIFIISGMTIRMWNKEIKLFYE